MTQTRDSHNAPNRHPRLPYRWLLWLLIALLAVLLPLLRWGGYLLVASNSLPAHAQGAVVLQGSVLGEISRVAGAIGLLRQGTVSQVLLSVPRESYWGQSVPDAARGYLEKNYGSEIASRFVFCETGPEVDSTQQEAEALIACVHQRGWTSIVVVTSNYHTRRAGWIWRKMLRDTQPPVNLAVDGVPDPEFQPQDWWRRRLYAKTWFYEFTKLVSERLL
jgi:uncharacterized SAM-binding protein YcdF (DUF218 family)